MTPIPRIPTDPTARRLWLKLQLEQLGSSYAAIARRLGCTPQNVRAAVFQPSRRAEDAIAAELGLTAQQIWPERFRGDGSRKSDRMRARSAAEDNIGNNARRNGDARRVA